MPSFEEIMSMPASQIERPPALPVGTYHCMVDGPPTREESSQKKTPCWVYKFKILSILGDVNAQAAAEQQVIGKVITGQGAGAAFYVTSDSSWRYKEFLTDHLGIEEGTKNMTEMQAEAPGKQVLVKLTHQVSQDGTRVYHRVESTAHV